MTKLIVPRINQLQSFKLIWFTPYNHIFLTKVLSKYIDIHVYIFLIWADYSTLLSIKNIYIVLGHFNKLLYLIGILILLYDSLLLWYEYIEDKGQAAKNVQVILTYLRKRQTNKRQCNCEWWYTSLIPILQR